MLIFFKNANFWKNAIFWGKCKFWGKMQTLGKIANFGGKYKFWGKMQILGNVEINLFSPTGGGDALSHPLVDENNVIYVNDLISFVIILGKLAFNFLGNLIKDVESFAHNCLIFGPRGGREHSWLFSLTTRTQFSNSTVLDGCSHTRGPDLPSPTLQLYVVICLNTGPKNIRNIRTRSFHIQ